MVNTKEFSARLNKILDYYDLSAASFADKIDVGRSSISHIISGRNKPSLDFVMKVVQNFPEVELYWLLNGKGNFPSPEKNKSSQNETLEKGNETPTLSEKEDPGRIPIQEKKIIHSPIQSGKQIQKIVIFYADGSFDAFEN